ncbi:hypothetical protein EDB84DRAFT_767403 [Lactarius hengduanensis]|nr:hypothetical protein EDB84DRAFT_767403 [Lactarius hengduanensis]
MRLHVLLDLQPHMVGRKKAMRDFLWGRVSLPPQLLIHDDILGIRLRFWLNLWPLAFLSNTTPVNSTLPPSQSCNPHKKDRAYPSGRNPKRSGTSAPASSQSRQRRYSPSSRGPRHEDAMMASKLTLSSLAWLTSTTAMHDIPFAVSLSGAARWKSSHVGTTSASCARLPTRPTLCSCLMCTT